jgi:nucleoside transporter
MRRLAEGKGQGAKVETDRAATISPRDPRPKLAVMMFLQFAGLGAWIVPFAGWLLTTPDAGGLGFSAKQTAAIYAMFAVGGLISPFITGLLADRFFSSQKLVGVLHLAMTGLLVAAGVYAQRYSGASADPSSAFPLLLAILGVYSILCVLAITIANSMAMRTLANPRETFGQVRLVGTFGWIVTTALEDLHLRAYSSDAFVVAAICHGLLGVFAWWLPHTPPKGKGRPLAEVVGLPAIKLFRDRSFVVFAIVAFLTQVMQQFFTTFANKYFTELQMFKPGVMMTIGQWVEMGCMAAMPFMASRVGLKRTMMLGLLGWVLRNLILMQGELYSIILLALPMHGWSYTFFTIIASLYIDEEAPPHLRAGAQSLLTFVSGGPGTLLGFWLAGYVHTHYTHAGVTDWHAVWLVPLVGTVVATVVFLIFFHEPQQPQPLKGDMTPELEPENP